MLLAPTATSSNHSLNGINKSDKLENKTIGLKSFINLILGSRSESSKLQEQTRNAISIDDLASMVVYSNGSSIVNYHAINNIGQKNNIDKHDLIFLANEFKDFLNSKPDCLSINRILKKRAEKSKTPFLDFLHFFSKNNDLSNSDPKLFEIYESRKKSDPEITIVLRSIYDAFLLSDELGVKKIKELEALEKNAPNGELEKVRRSTSNQILAGKIFSNITLTAKNRLLNKLVIQFVRIVNQKFSYPSNKNQSIGLKLRVHLRNDNNFNNSMDKMRYPDPNSKFAQNYKSIAQSALNFAKKNCQS